MTSPLDWNGKLHVVNGSPLSTPYPRDRYFWAVTEDGAMRVTFWEDNLAWTGAVAFHTEPDEFTAVYQADEILGWTDSQEDAEEAAVLLAKLLERVS
ncbi:hypothetical protein [Phenylobacterium sp.]|uniref:hypothetical protein n=1 Tax=Phenylobacterium sp. TaxID=1871053 RepID=UPI002FCA4163